MEILNQIVDAPAEIMCKISEYDEVNLKMARFEAMHQPYFDQPQKRRKVDVMNEIVSFDEFFRNSIKDWSIKIFVPVWDVGFNKVYFLHYREWLKFVHNADKIMLPLTVWRLGPESISEAAFHRFDPFFKRARYQVGKDKRRRLRL